jgi:hypothetical protein
MASRPAAIAAPGKDAFSVDTGGGECGELAVSPVFDDHA